MRNPLKRNKAEIPTVTEEEKNSSVTFSREVIYMKNGTRLIYTDKGGVPIKIEVWFDGRYQTTVFFPGAYDDGGKESKKKAKGFFFAVKGLESLIDNLE